MKKPFLVLLSLGAASAVTAESIDFNRDIRPILSDNCFHCHGPSETGRKAKLRLDLRDAAIESGALQPGDPHASELVARILTTDPDDLMPPPDSNKQLTARQREMLQTWIREGAEYQDHWSFVGPRKTEVPSAENAIDYLVKRRLEAANLEFSPPADRHTLIRRLTLDLTGLPPTPEDVEAFVKDPSPHAYETVVDRLLRSPAYGERMTLAWLDAARYGDTSVMHADGPRDMWPWRDWVLEAYNRNLPFDQFTTEQLAGDLIPNGSVAQKVASGFNRNHATSDEGGAFAEELRVEYVADRVMTTATVWMGLTMECAQCHDHKYDPISQKEYYQFFAYFNNTSDPGMQTRRGNQAPIVEVESAERIAKLAELQSRTAEAKNKIAEHEKSVAPKFAAWAEKKTAEFVAAGKKVREVPGLAHWFPLDEGSGKELKNKVTGSIAILEKGKLETSDRGNSKALKLNGGTQFQCSADAPVLKEDEGFSFAAWLKHDGRSGGAVFSRMDVENRYRGWDLHLQGASLAPHIINTWNSDAIKVVSVDGLKKDTWQHVVVTYDGSKKASGVKIYIDGKLSQNKVEADTLKSSIETDVPFKIGSRSNGANWKGEVDDIRIYSHALSPEEVPLAKGDVIGGILATAKADRSPEQENTLRRHYLTQEDKAYPKLVAAHAKVAKEHADLKAKPATSMIMGDNSPDKMRMTYVLDRGHYDSPKKEEVIPVGVPAALPALPDGAPPSRLGLAQWLTSDEHPLTARVAVNRYWTLLFGEGLVRTAGDFGAQGAPPTHPLLLDWLAVDFVESGWDVKRILKKIVMSQTYRQSSRTEPHHLKSDPENLLLARSPRFRLQGEFIRDQALAVSGLLVHQLGGPGVKPYQPPNIWNEVSLNGGLRYPQDKGTKLYRRSLYTYWKRSAPMPNMIIFDAPTREKCVVQRARTNTPLQALVTLNDPQFVEAARALAQRLIQEGGGETASRLDFAFQLVASRPPSSREQTILSNLLKDQRQRFSAQPESAQQFLGVGESSRDDSIDPIEHAAWMVVAQTILNLDETLTRS